jgi:diaminohydroxyphosphoribosylaminopyrimidine deaminase / 5-amino-6-(5-phosphoribosylamino)uracil reductase
VVALRRTGELAVGGTAVVTLERCNHVGKSPLCVDALVDAGISTVVYAVADPNPIAAGGATRLAAAGVAVLLFHRIASGRMASVHRDLLTRVT